MRISFGTISRKLYARNYRGSLIEFTFDKGNSTADDILNELSNTESIIITDDEDKKIESYVGYNDILQLTDYNTGALTIRVVNTVMFEQSLDIEGRVSVLENNNGNLSERTQNLEVRANDFEESQDNQDDIIADLLDV